MAREVKYLLKKKNYSHGERYFANKKYSDTKNGKKSQLDPDDMPQHEGIKKRGRFSEVDTSLVKRWLYSQVGKNFDLVFSEFRERVQTKYLAEYGDCIYRYVIRKEFIKIIDGEPHELISGLGHKKIPYNKWSCFFIHPETNMLHVASTYKRKKK